MILLLMHSTLALSGIWQNVDKSHPYSSSEGIISIQHDNEFANFKKDLFFTENLIDINKIKKLLESIEGMYDEHEKYTYQSEKLKYIELYFLSPNEAHKRAVKRIKGNKSYLYGIERFKKDLKKLKRGIEKNELSDKDIAEKISYLTLLYTTIYNPQNYNIFTGHIWTFKKIIAGFYKLYKDRRRSIFPSNLYDLERSSFYSQEELKNKFVNGDDLSLIDPPSSPLWRKTHVEKFDAFEEEYKGKQIFPDKKIDTPVMFYKRMGSGQIKIKTFFYDNKENKKEVTLKLGREVYANVLSSKLAKAVGFPSLALTYRSKVKLILGEKSYSDFLGEWRSHHLESSSDYISEYIPEENSVILKNVSLEAYPEYEKNYYKLGSFRSGKNGLNNRREYRALLVFASLIGWSDAREKNIRVDVYRENKKDDWKLIYMLNDLGQSMGNWFSDSNPNAVNNYFSNISRKTLFNDNVWLLYNENEQNPAIWRNVLKSDARWIVRKYAKLQPKQFIDICLSSGLSEPIANLYAQKIIRRINNLIKALKIDDIEKIETIKFSDLSDYYFDKSGIRYFNSKGRLLDAADSDHDNSLWYRGSKQDLVELATIGSFNAIAGVIKDQITSIALGGTVNAGKITIDLLGIEIFPSRKIEVNQYHQNFNKRFLVKDTFVLKVPLGAVYDKNENDGFEYTLPVGVYKEFVFEHIHSYFSKEKAALAPFFKKMLPWKLNSIKLNLKRGEQVYIESSQGFSLGSFGVKYNDIASLKFSPIEHKKLTTEKVYISKLQNGEIEVSTMKSSKHSNWSGIELEAYISLIKSKLRETENRTYKKYRFHNTIEDLEQFKELVFGGSSDLLTKKSSLIITEVHNKTEQKNEFLIWRKKKQTSINQIEINSSNFKAKTLIRGAYSRSNGRSVKSALNEDAITKTGQGVQNYFGAAFEESKKVYVNLEGNLTNDKQGLKDLVLTIDLVIFDAWATRKEYKENFIKEINKTINSGKKKIKGYLNFSMDENLSHFSPLTATMHWQLNQSGLEQLLDNIENVPGWCVNICINKLRNVRNNSGGPKDVVTNIISLISNLLKDSRNLGRIRDIVDDEYLWVSTHLDSVLYSVIPLSMDRNNYVFAREIGHFKGHTSTSNFIYKTDPNIKFSRKDMFNNFLDASNTYKLLELKQ